MGWDIERKSKNEHVSDNNLQNQFSSSTIMWILGIKLGSPGLHDKCLYLLSHVTGPSVLENLKTQRDYGNIVLSVILLLILDYKWPCLREQAKYSLFLH